MAMDGKERREDRRDARHQKHEDIKDGESRKEAREDKHEMKKADREKWKEEGHGIGGDIEETGIATEAVVEDFAEIAAAVGVAAIL